MQKFNKKTLIIFLAVFVVCCCFVVGITVIAEDANTTVDPTTGTNSTDSSCLNEGDKELYQNILAEAHPSLNGWKTVISNLPSSAVVKVAQIGSDGNRIESGSYHTTANELWSRTIELTNDVELIEVEVTPNYLSSKPECKSFGVEFSVFSVTESSDVSLDSSIYDDLLSGTTPDDGSYIPTGKSKETLPLSCSSDPSVKINSYSSTDTKVEKHDYCTKSCKETVTVTYGVPMVVQAGGAIEYEVTVESNVDCRVTDVNIPTPKTKKVCVPRPSCSGGFFDDNESEKAGPNEEFDSCVISCDNGNYTQDCINKCYQEVYQNELVYESLSYSSPIQIQRVYTVVEGEVRNGANTKGSYTGSGSNITWKSSISDCNKYTANGNCAGFYYYSTASKAAWTNRMLSYQNKDFGGVLKTYYIDTGGFLRGISDGRNCDSVCKWVGCAGVPGKDYYLTKAEAEAALEKEVAQVERERIEQCKAVPSTENKSTTYTITVTNPDNKKTTFSTKNENYKKTMLTSSTTTNKLSYKFPEAYIDSDGKVEYGLTKTNGYKYGGNKFYTSLLSNNTNVEWYHVKMGDKKLSEIDIKGIEQNIQAQIRNFGYLNWNFDINCFYAINEDDSGDQPDNGDPKYTDFIFRPISLDDVFPTSEEAPDGRDPRWNWSCSATNTRNGYYPINPVTLTSNIQNKGDSIYDEANENKELDYEIYLDRSTMSKIREDNKKRDSYLDYDDMTCVDKNGMLVCTSGFLRNTAIFGNSVKKLGLVGCNNQSSSNTCDYSTWNLHSSGCLTYFGNQSYNIISNNKVGGE